VAINQNLPADLRFDVTSLGVEDVIELDAVGLELISTDDAVDDLPDPANSD
jgi:hypothetical protein